MTGSICGRVRRIIDFHHPTHPPVRLGDPGQGSGGACGPGRVNADRWLRVGAVARPVGGMPGFERPAEFEACRQVAPRGLLDPSAELWLIKAPADFEPRSFSGKKVPLVGFQTLQSKLCQEKVYNVFATPGRAGSVCLILPSEAEGRSESCSDFAGCITIDENWEDASNSTEARSIPASSAPNIPADLKLRFQPFGVGPPGWSPQKRQPAPSSRKKGTKENGGLLPGPQAADSETPADSRKKKKKRSKERQEEVVFQTEDPESRNDPETEHKHKKKKKRNKDESYETVPSESDCTRKKKRKKDKD